MLLLGGCNVAARNSYPNLSTHTHVARSHSPAGERRGHLCCRSSSNSPSPLFLLLSRSPLQVAELGVKELPHVMRIMRQPDMLNEAYSFRYQSRPWPLCHVPQTTEVRGAAANRPAHTRACARD
jgi:hypothetical protein